MSSSQPRLKLRYLLLAVNLTVLWLPLLGLEALRLYDSALVRQTESELIAQAAFVAASYRVAVGRQLHDRPHAPNPVTGLGRREERREHRVADAVGPVIARIKRRHRDHRHDGAGDEVPVVVRRDRDHWLDV
jgi:hypothetical protein